MRYFKADNMVDSKIKKILFSLILSIFLLTGIIGLVQGQNLEHPPDVPILGEGGVLDRIAVNLLKVLVFGAVILFIYAGFLFLTSSGDPQKFDTVKKTVLYGIIGLLVAFSAWGIVELVKKIFLQP